MEGSRRIPTGDALAAEWFKTAGDAVDEQELAEGRPTTLGFAVALERLTDPRCSATACNAATGP